jgi:hypothetical protein
VVFQKGETTMLVIEMQASKKRTLTVIGGSRKQSGTVCIAFQNDHDEIYRVSLFQGGTAECRHQKDSKHHEECPSRGRCYHVKAARLISVLFDEDGPVAKDKAPQAYHRYYRDEEPTLQGYDVVKEVSAIVADAWIGDAYEQMEKKHLCPGCYGYQGEGKSKDCKPGFCLWNSLYTEAIREQNGHENGLTF